VSDPIPCTFGFLHVDLTTAEGADDFAQVTVHAWGQR
jgi:hypothetical protein